MSKNELTAGEFVKKLETYRSDKERDNYSRYFKTGKGEYGEGDIFMGVRMGQVFALAKEFIDMELVEVEKLLESPIHETRTGAVSIMDFQARRKKTPESRRKELYDLYLRRHDRINNWDLVDRAAPYVVGGYLFDKPRDILFDLAHSENIWERRTAIISTGYFIKKREPADAFKIAELLVNDTEDLIHKAVGWMLRASGDTDQSTLLNFLDHHAATMPRTMLSYAVEHLEPEQKTHYRNLKSKA